jgi:hypothetical protein
MMGDRDQSAGTSERDVIHLWNYVVLVGGIMHYVESSIAVSEFNGEVYSST